MNDEGIAIVGMDVRFPGAGGVEAFWRNLRAGAESTTFFTEVELRAAGVAPALLADPRYVRANGVLPGIEDFDAEFFGLTPREAEITDPQHRIFLELAWTALERAGYDGARFPGRAAVFAGAGPSTYLLKHLAPNRALVESAGEMALLLGNNPDFASTRVSYKLNLRGASMAVNTACSTSLVAVHLACQSLLDLQCDLALAGGVSVQVPQAQGYLHQEGAIGSPDGRCRAFDAQAAGTVGGSGAGVVVLKRLAEARADGDTIHAIIRGSAVNNDGADKVGFTAPSVAGQAQAIAEAQAAAGVSPREISYIEAHGTATALGDPIEVAALTEVFRAQTADRGFCALGSVKTNFGHLNEAAGIAGLVKVVLSLERGELPPSLHFTAPNPKIDFAAGPFYVNARLAPWPARAGAPRRAGVSSFGIGGTNAHVVLEEAPEAPAAADGGTPQLLVLSARTRPALDQVAENLAEFLESGRTGRLADVAYTLAVGRREFAHRRYVVARNAREAAAALRAPVSAATGAALDSLAAVGRAWVEGKAVDWPARFAGSGCGRVPLPTYPFERRRYWIDEFREAAAGKRPLGAEWFYQPSWRQAAAPAGDGKRRTVLWLGPGEPARAATALWEDSGLKVSIEENPGKAITKDGCVALLARAAKAGLAPTDIVQAWNAAPWAPAADFAAAQRSGYEAVLALVQAWVQVGRPEGARLTVLVSHLADVTGEEPLVPARATLLGLAKVIPQEFPGLGCRIVDVTGLAPAVWGAHLATEIAGDGADGCVAFRGRRRWVQGFTPLRLDAAAGAARLRPRGVYLITGGLGGVALIIADYLARTFQARLVLVARRGLSAGAGNPAGDLPDPHGLAGAAAELAARSDLAAAASYAAFARESDGFAALLIFHYLADPAAVAGDSIGAGELRRRRSIHAPFERCFDYFLGILAADGYLRREGDTLVWLRAPADAPAPAQAAAALAARHPQFRGIVDLLAHCARHYPEALSGRVPAIGVLYPEGRSDLLEQAGRDSARQSDKEARIALLRELIDRVVAAAGGRRLRILEVGVGDGLLAGQVAPGLAGRPVDYVATDLSRAFVVKAERAAAAAGLDFVSFGVLDITRDPVPQGFARESFDLIIALDVVHATPRLADTLGNLDALLAPGGKLGLIEKTRDERWVNLVWGLAEGWWCFADAEWRRDVPLLPAAAWERLLGEVGFGAAAAYPTGQAARAAADYALLVADKASGRTAAGRTAAVRRLASLGAEVVVEEADAADAGQMASVVARAEARFGTINGVVHAAGLTAGPAVFNLLPAATAEQARALFHPKAVGAEVLAAVLQDRRLDFCVLISSNAAVLGGLGLAAYAAASAHLDILAAEQRRRGAAGWISTNWDGWPTQGPEAARRVQTSIDRYALTREEAEAAFVRILAAPVPQVVVSSGDLPARLRHWVELVPAGTAAAEPGRASSWHTRPAGLPALVEPRTGLERAVAALWSELLGIDRVGVEDNFFDLEGDSLLGTQLVARLSRDFGVTLSVGTIFEAPTVAALAERIERSQSPVRTVSSDTEEEGTL